MSNKYTQEEIYNIYKNNQYELISEYKGNNTTLFVKDEEGYICSSKLSVFKKGSNPCRFHTTNPYTIQNIKLWININRKEYELLSTEYKNSGKNKLYFKCPEGHKFEMTWGNFQQGQSCPKCSHHQVSEETSIYSVAPWMMDLGVSEEDAKKYLPQSSQKITVTCPNCGKEKEVVIYDVYNSNSIRCNNCSDGISYPEKVLISLLNQLGIEYKHDSYWIKNKRYDFYFEYDGRKYIIETHGRQHYEHHTFSFNNGRTLEEEQKNDKYKKELALSNGIDNYIELDCRESDLQYIKNSILNSKLNDIFDLDKINWNNVLKFVLKNKVKEVCDYWNTKETCETTVDVGKIFNLDRQTICEYLKKGAKLGWCNYDSKEEIKKSLDKGRISSCKQVEIFKDGKSLGIFPSCSELSKQSEKLFGIKLLENSISEVCRGRRKSNKGFTFKYV